MAHYIWLWLIPLVAHSTEAHAWGLATHVYFAQLLLWAVPLADPRLRRAVRALPRLVLAGACLPDIALAVRDKNGSAFGRSHDWAFARQLLDVAGTDAERAIAVGYASHLFVDITAHNHFVPAHEALWVRVPLFTHAVAEWVVDAHVTPHLFLDPARLLSAEQRVLADYVATRFECSTRTAQRVLGRLATASRCLYGSRLHTGLRAGARLMDKRLAARCDHYVTETAARLPQINRLLAGEAPSWRADLPCPERTHHFSRLSGEALRGPLPLPANLFV